MWTHSFYCGISHGSVFVGFLPWLLHSLGTTLQRSLETNSNSIANMLIINFCLEAFVESYFVESSAVFHREGNVLHTISMQGLMCTHNYYNDYTCTIIVIIYRDKETAILRYTFIARVKWRFEDKYNLQKKRRKVYINDQTIHCAITLEQ